MCDLTLFYGQCLLTSWLIIPLILFLFCLGMSKCFLTYRCSFFFLPSSNYKIQKSTINKEWADDNFFILRAARHFQLTPLRKPYLPQFTKSLYSAAISLTSLDLGLTTSCVHTFCLLHLSLASGSSLLSDILMLSSLLLHYLNSFDPQDALNTSCLYKT